jgi:eukaryotic-like serine/threonine-protein kinase
MSTSPNDSIGGPPNTSALSIGHEPLPGYRLLRPLGRGGFGEVWECEAPGGLHKAIKFVFDDSSLSDPGGSDRLRQEYEAFQKIRALRHPFLLGLERVERTDNALVMVMELADRTLAGRHEECRDAGLPGIPRNELLIVLYDVAQALDLIGSRHGLQHLDVKPANVFVFSGRGKIGDYGLVRRLEGAAPGKLPGITPKYVPPEVACGRVDPRSDQYSLALVYFEMLTGKFPFHGRSIAQMLMLHASGVPDLVPLPPRDRPIIARALAKKPEERYSSCRAFVKALSDAASGIVAAPRPRITAAVPVKQDKNDTVEATAHPTTTAPALARSSSKRAVHLTHLEAVVPLSVLTLRMIPCATRPTAKDYIRAMIWAASKKSGAEVPADPTRTSDDRWVCQFPVRARDGGYDRSLDVLRDRWQVKLTRPDETRAILQFRTPGRGLWKLGGRSVAAEIEISLPRPRTSVGEAVVTGRLIGSSVPAYAQYLPLALADIKAELQNQSDRRAAARLKAELGAEVYPVTDDGRVLSPVRVKTQDVSMTGIRFMADTPIPTRRVYLAFPGLGTVRGWAVLTNVIRRSRTAPTQIISGRFTLAG